ncbi:MAG: DNA-binding protein Alba [Candidatus Heimdallarchaeota archaeon]|nr:DNA-binding protein Alba [Candidatus Heimdallarchaeota archaeon]MCG3255813.1 DNA-binding protein Alba [Candidatus Heimdallarchaeota archaeon]MCK4610886.1 DNA-binding protein Alba [Candidatus Heimdallarchaeota archaeon]
MSKDEKKNAIYIGKKGTMNYCLVVVTIFNKGEEECTILARGRSISKAVDVAEISKNRFLPEIVEIADVTIGSEVLDSDGQPKTVSTIDILMKRKV